MFAHLMFNVTIEIFHCDLVSTTLYRVIFDNLHQELTIYRLVLTLLRFLKASMLP